MTHRTIKALVWAAAVAAGGTGAKAAITSGGLVDRFDADAGVTTDGTGAVTGWTNLGSGAGVSVADPQTSVVAGPAGQAMVRFNNTAQGAGLGYSVTNPSTTATDPTSLNNGYTAFATVRLNAAYANFYRVLRTTSDTQAPMFLRSTGVMEVKANPLATADRPTASFSGYVGGASVIPTPVVVVTARLTPTAQDLYFNGTLVSHKAIAVPSYTFAAADNVWELGNGLVGDVGDILLYNNSAPVAGLNETGRTLATQYGLTWDSTGIVPEPAALGLLAPAGLLLARRRRTA
jgi:hypothetical protein